MTAENSDEGLPTSLRPLGLVAVALAVSFARVLQDIAPRSDALALLQTQVAVQLARLRETHGGEEAAAIWAFVRDKLRDPSIVPQDE